ncbi:MBL fold metallo-hydrolase [Robertmurraya andreesenii]|uniref:L-ascorbate metabolism protein UlaG (Beta-lactamase superfamily) n=1 Tax=Anoxybacillus andreesenii TaxID=1325932 RepID=A0ABT9V192_9BACL|nr:MBL fold metallo-hydrolase [Robertmurraya andreesenii]MDQ0154723.1 L-ascorbate metabolism protein UlaG (beta-lactamase superfamily) [Robertmurraya andreesenii]
MKKTYSNLNNVSNKKSFQDMRKWQKERRNKTKDLSENIPQYPNKRIQELKENRSRTSYTWIGHSTFLIQLNGLNILTDPVWAKRMGFQKRLTEPGIPLEELPEIDAVVISHGHYDHLDFRTLKKLKGNPQYFVPVGMKSLFAKKGYHNVIEMSWWERAEYKGIHVHFVPAQHWTRRTLTDMNTSHWGGWIFQTAGETFYFVGDTGYFSGFKEIAERFTIDMVFMPIGAYEPEWFMADSHISPEDSVKAFIELEAKQFVPMHYGAYRLADDTGPEALERLVQAWEKQELPKEQLQILLIGETVML